MFSRRTRARIGFVTSTLSLLFTVLVRRRFHNGGEAFSVVPQWLVAGGVYQALSCWAYDRDLGGIRTSRWRHVLLVVFRFLLGLGLALGLETSAPSSARRNVSLGQNIGKIGYRLWYGVLRPLPGTDE